MWEKIIGFGIFGLLFSGAYQGDKECLFALVFYTVICLHYLLHEKPKMERERLKSEAQQKAYIEAKRLKEAEDKY